MSHTLSIIVVTLNEAPHITRLKRAINQLHNPSGVSVESILIDGGSSDGTADAARRAGFDKVFILPGASIPLCRNRGLAEANGNWIAFLDGDCEPAPNWLENARLYLEPETTIIIGWPAEPPEPMPWVQAAWQFHWLNKNRQREEWNGRFVIRQEGFRLVTTRNMLFSRPVLARVGRFNEELITGEDTDFAFRAYQAGIPVLGIPALRVIHYGEPRTLREFYRQQVWHANRRSYQTIAQAGGRVGGNAPLFTRLFGLTLLLFIAGLLLWIVTAAPYWGLFLLPLPALIVLPAIVICGRGGKWRHLPALAVLYSLYAMARLTDWMGLAQAKPNWKKTELSG